LERNTCQWNVGEGIHIFGGKPSQVANITDNNNRPDPRKTWTIYGKAGDNRHAPKHFQAFLGGHASPQDALERVARTLNANWQISGRLEPRLDLRNGLSFHATQRYERDGCVTIEICAFTDNNGTMLSLSFFDNSSLMWLRTQQSEGLVVIALYAIATALEPWTGKAMPWVCTAGNWVQEQGFSTSAGLILQVAKC
jgi:hypothetical protein